MKRLSGCPIASDAEHRNTFSAAVLNNTIPPRSSTLIIASIADARMLDKRSSFSFSAVLASDSPSKPRSSCRLTASASRGWSSANKICDARLLTSESALAMIHLFAILLISTRSHLMNDLREGTALSRAATSRQECGFIPWGETILIFLVHDERASKMRELPKQTQRGYESPRSKYRQKSLEVE